MLHFFPKALTQNKLNTHFKILSIPLLSLQKKKKITHSFKIVLIHSSQICWVSYCEANIFNI